MKKKIGIGIIVVLVVMQFFRIDKTNPPVDNSKDLLYIAEANEDVTLLVRKACYDCHSNETTYPWYTNVAPVSWWIKHHIDEGREELNFSEWTKYDAEKADHKLEECVEMLEEGEMPLSSYTITHGEAELSEEDKHKLMDWFESLRE